MEEEIATPNFISRHRARDDAADLAIRLWLLHVIARGPTCTAMLA
jgi:hypothetical protein